MALPETPVIVKPTEVLDQAAFGVGSDTSKDNGIAEYKGNTSTTYSVSGPNTVKVNEEITLKCDGRHSWNIKNDSDKVQLVGNRNANTVTVKGMKEGSASVYCKNESNAQEITVTKAEYQAYFYVLLPNVNLPYEYNADEWWYGMGIGSIATERPASDYGYNGLGTTLNDLLNTDKITYPESFPNLTIDGIIYTYDASATKQNSYSIVWHTVIVSNGANAGKNEYNKPVIKSNNTGKSDRNTYHVDGTLVLNETEKRTVMFKCQYPTSDTDTFKEVTGYTVRVADGYQESELRQPNMGIIDGYTFDGWYYDEGCTRKADFNNTITENTVYYGKYVEKTYTVTWKDWDGTVLETNANVEHGTTVNQPTNPTKADDNQYTYTFKHWSTTKNGEAATDLTDPVTADRTYYAVYEATLRKHTVTWKNWDETVLTTDANVEHGTTVAMPTNPTKADDNQYTYTFKHWSTTKNGEAATDLTQPVTADRTYYAVYEATKKENPPTPITNLAYKIIQHFRDGKGNPSAANPDITTNKTTTNAQAKLDSLITDDLKQAKTRTDGKTYVYVPSETKFTVNSGAVTALVDGTEIHLYYYLDETGTPGKDSEGKDTDTPNGQPDAWEYKATFIVKNGQWDTNPTGGKDTIVKYLPTKDITTGKNIQATLSNVPTAGNTPDSHYKAGSWDPKPNEDDVITKDMTYTYTYSWRSSGGSGGSNRPKPPVVEIPDDVPTGLNGKDHYAYIIGYGNNDVRPQNNITRAEVATIFFRLLTDETRTANMTKSNSYNDVKDGDWFCCAVSTLSKMGIIKGYEDGSFKPNDPISRAEFAAIAARFDPNGDKTPASFFDVTSHWAKDEISIAANHGWIKGYEDGSFKPDQKITRAETMTLVNRVLNRLPETKDDLHKDMKTWVDNMDETAWYYLAVQEATNSHYFKNKTGTKFEQWTDLRDTRDWSELEK